MNNEFHDDLLEELSQYGDSSDPFEGLSKAEKLEHLIVMEKFMFSDTWLYCLRGAAVLLDIIIIPWAFKAICAIGGKDLGPIGALYFIAICFCFVFSSVVFDLENCKQRAEKKLQAEEERKAEAKLQNRLSEIDALTITNKVTFKRVTIRLLFCVGPIFALTAITFGLGIVITDSFGSLMRDVCTPGWGNFFIFPVSVMTAMFSMVPVIKTLFAWNGSCLTFDKSGIRGEVYNTFDGVQDVTDYYANKTKDGSIVERHYDINVETQPHSIKWKNFKCFSVHHNCLVLWQKEQVKAGLLTKLYIKFGWDVSLNQCPLRIIGTSVELAELKYMMSKIMPCCHNFWPREKAII